MSRLLLLAAIAFGLYLVLRRRVQFRMTFQRGHCVRTSGQASAQLRQAFEDVARLSRLSGQVVVYDESQLRFSGDIHEDERQRFRNVLSNGS